MLTDPADVQHAADALADGGVVGHGFANVYAITTRPDADIVQRVNHMHDRPADGPGSITVPPERIPDLFDWTQLPPGLTRRSVLRAVDAFYRFGAIRVSRSGRRAPSFPPDLPRGGRRDDASHRARLQLPIERLPGPGACRRGHRRTPHRLGKPGPTTAPASRFSSIRTMTLLGLGTPATQATSATILGFHRPVRVAGDRRPQLLLERHGIARCRHRAPDARRPRPRPRCQGRAG